MKFIRTAPKKSFNFSTLSQSETQLHLVPVGQIKAFEKTLPEVLRKQYQAKKIEWKNDKNTSCSLQYSDGGSFKILALAAKQSTFTNHTDARKFLASFIKDNGETFHVNLGLLKQDDAQFWIDALVSLSIHEGWDYPKITSEKKKEPKKEVTTNFYTAVAPAAFERTVKNARATAEATDLVRTLALMPPNYLNPRLYREEIKKIAATKKLKYEFWDRKELLKLKAGAFLAVTQADPDDQGGIARLVYKPKSVKNKTVLTLVGKGLCFDTGGYNVKTGSYMNGMQEDMTGSAIALASLAMLAEMNYPLEVHAYLAIAENHLSPTGFKPNDVVTASNGKTIEIENTDAEGRMVLADTLALASREKPGLIIDFATLTGACFRALSTRRSGVFTNRERIIPTLHQIGDLSGERVWGFPIGQDYEDGLKSDVADIFQCATEVNSDHIFAATFLNHFVEKDVPWIHIDLSAHKHKGGLGLVGTDTNGYGPRLTRALADAFLNKGLKF